MSDFDLVDDHEALIEGNPLVDPAQLTKAHEAMAALRRAGVPPRPSYGIDSPYERGPVGRPRSGHGGAPE